MRRGVLLLMLLLWTATAEAAGGRVALVIGNGAYRHGSVLPNAGNDGVAVAAALRRVGFDVHDGIDLDRAGTYDLLKRFARAVDGAAVAVFFYAGHGLQVAGENYLVPVDAELEHEVDLESETLAMKTILGQLERTDRTSIVILDACRDNPFAQRVRRTMTRSRAVGDGLAPVQSGVGTLIAYATQPDNVAQDGIGDHSPFTSALLRHLETPGLEVSQLMKRVRQEVIAETAQAQIPWDHSSLVGDFYFVPPAAAEIAALDPAAPADPPRVGDEQRFWDAAQQMADPGRKLQALEFYLERHPEGRFAGLARLQIDDLRQAREQPSAPGGGPTVTASRSDERPREQVVTERPAAVADPAALAERALGLRRADRRDVQTRLTRLGFDTGGSDGSFGPRSRAAIARFQVQAGLPATGFVDATTMARLAAAAAASAPALANREAGAPASPPPETRRSEPAASPPSPAAIVECRGPNDPDWVDFRLVTLAQCRRLGGTWTLL